jgi:hypothetical protein
VSANTNATVLAIAERAAALIKSARRKSPVTTASREVDSHA